MTPGIEQMLMGENVVGPVPELDDDMSEKTLGQME